MFALTEADEEAFDELDKKINEILAEENINQDEWNDARPLLRWAIENIEGRLDLQNNIVKYTILYVMADVSDWQTFLTKENLMDFFGNLHILAILVNADFWCKILLNSGCHPLDLSMNLQPFFAEQFIAMYEP